MRMGLSPLAIKPWRSDLQTPSLHPLTKVSNLQPKEESLQFPEAQEAAMVSARRLVQLVKKWQRMPALGRKRLTSLTIPARETEVLCETSTVASKGCCTVYTADGVRFEVPLAFLGTMVFAELLRMSREEFGFAGSDGGRITLPCDVAVMEYVMRLLGRNISMEMEKAFLSSMVMMPCHYDVAPHLGFNQQVAVCSS